MATDKSIVVKLELDVARAKANISKLQTEIQSLDMRFNKNKVKAKQLAVEYDNLAKSQAKLATATTKSATAQSVALDGVSKSSGAASAATLELGRAISDAPYGIRGIANNVSQFASQIAFMSRSMDAATGRAIGLSGAMKALWRSILGPLGVLLAIQAAIAALDHFAGSTKKAEEELENLSEEFDNIIQKINLVARHLPTALDPLLKSLGLADGGLKEFNSELESTVKILTNEFPEFARAYKNLSDTQKGDAKVVSGLVLKYLELIQTRADIAKQEAIISDYKDKEAKGAQTTLASEKEKYRNLLLQKATLEDIFKVESKSGASTANRIKEYKQQLFDLTKFILKQQQEEFEFTERNEWNLLKSKQEFEEKDLKATYDAYLAKNQLRHDNFIKEAKDEDAINRAKATLAEANSVAELEFKKGAYALENKQTAEDNEFKRKVQEKHDAAMLQLRSKSSQMALKANKKIYGTEAGSVGSPVSKTGAEGFDLLEEAYRAAGVIDDEAFETALALKEEQLRSSKLSEEQIKAELAEMSYQNELERTQREIDLEKMKIDAKRNINEEYISWVSGLGSVFKSLAGDNEALAKAALVLEKGAAIAGVVISTQSANAKILAATSTEASALRAQAALAGPAGAPLYAKAIAAEAAGAKRITKNNIGSGISIAKILATTLSSGGASSGGASGGGGTASQDRTFDFNLVGNTGVNQLAQGIAGQFNGPIQAYVVASQVTSQQQLDATIQSNATIG